MSHLSFYLFVTNVIGLVTFFLASNLSILQIPTRRNDLFVQSKKREKRPKKGQRRPVVVVVVVVMYTHRIEASEVSELQTCSCNISSCMEFLLHRLIHRSSKREHVAAHVASPSSPFEWISTLPSCSATQYFSSQSSALLTKAATSRVNKLFLFKCNKFLTKICKIFYTVKNFGRQVTLI